MILRKVNPNMNDQEYIDNIPTANKAVIDHILQKQIGASSTFPEDCPVEIHPYIGEVDLENFEKYIIGTFPPISYVLDLEEIVEAGITKIDSNVRPKIPYYHGNSIQMWKLFFNDDFFDFESNNDKIRIRKREEVLSFLKEKEINYSDIIFSAKRDAYNANDSGLRNVVVYIDLIKHILQNNNVNRLLFNTSTTFSSTGINIHQKNVKDGILGRININSNCNSFDLFFRACQDLGFKVEFKLEDSETNSILDWTEVSLKNTKLLSKFLKTKIVFKAKISVASENDYLNNSEAISKEFYVLTPFSPSLAARNLGSNPIVSNWLLNNPNLRRYDLLKLIYSKFITFNEDDKIFLTSLNQ